MKKVYNRGLVTGTGKSTLRFTQGMAIETHEEVAARFFNIPVADVTETQRQYIKRLRFASIYGSNCLLMEREYDETTIIPQDFTEAEARVLAWAASNNEDHDEI